MDLPEDKWVDVSGIRPLTCHERISRAAGPAAGRDTESELYTLHNACAVKSAEGCNRCVFWHSEAVSNLKKVHLCRRALRNVT